MFLVRVTNAGTDAFFDSNALYPFPVPEPGGCERTGGFTCELIGVSCVDAVTVIATVDSLDSVDELDESNNMAEQPF